jgi:hypothetical protein
VISSSVSQLPWLFFFAHYSSFFWCAQQQLLTGDENNTARKGKLLFVVCSLHRRRENGRWYYITCSIHAFSCAILSCMYWTNRSEKVDKFEIDSTLLLELLFKHLRTKTPRLDRRMSHTLIGILLIWMTLFDAQWSLSSIHIVCLVSMLGLVSLNGEFDV